MWCLTGSCPWQAELGEPGEASCKIKPRKISPVFSTGLLYFPSASQQICTQQVGWIKLDEFSLLSVSPVSSSHLEISHQTPPFLCSQPPEAWSGPLLEKSRDERPSWACLVHPLTTKPPGKLCPETPHNFRSAQVSRTSILGHCLEDWLSWVTHWALSW